MITEVITHVTADGDRWDLLAWRYYGEATGYERIVAANPGVALSPVLPSGLTLNIPVLEEPPATLATAGGLPPWLT